MAHPMLTVLGSALDRGQDCAVLPVPMRDGALLQVRALGSPTGRPTLLLHGFCGKWRQMLFTARQLPQTRRLLLPDARGHGTSDGFGPVLKMAQLGQDLADLIAWTGAPQVDIIGLSMGAQMIFEYIRQFGTAKLGRLVFVDQGPRLRPEEGWPHALFGGMSDAEIAEFLGQMRDNPRRLGKAWLRGVWRSEEPRLIQLVLTPQLLAGLPGTPAHTLRLAEDMLQQDWREAVQTIDRPVLLCYGGRSMYPQAGRWMHAHIADSELAWFANSGHGLMFTEPLRFVGKVNAFLNQEP